ncbi:hypothetical protein GCM10008085_24470 [Winogradskyella epiphytica]|nr:hypothetical protein [Winogradskyella epiphytica]GGW71528.1 hypothetical protein GCM10008085_24470 [Winogradskyella epiphytica]
MRAWLLVQYKKQFYKDIIQNTESFKGIPYWEYIKFHTALSTEIPKDSLQLQALAYIDIFDKIFKKEQPNYLLTLGDSRLCVEIAVAIAAKYEVTTYYIEQGPFNTTFFDQEGVNANLSIRRNYSTKLIDKSQPNYEPLLNPNSTKYNRSPIYRGLDFLTAALLENSPLYPPDLKYTDVIHNPINKTEKLKNNPAGNHYSHILLALQVPRDVNMIYHSPNFKTHTEIVSNIYSNLPEGKQLVVREHPLYINKYDESLYKYIIENNILIDNFTPLDQALDSAEVIVVNNSTVGIEAILKYKTVVVLGNAFYDNERVCLKLHDKDQLKSLLQGAIHYKTKKAEIDTFKSILFNEVLLEGSISDKELRASKKIANHLITHQ